MKPAHYQSYKSLLKAAIILNNSTGRSGRTVQHKVCFILFYVAGCYPGGFDDFLIGRFQAISYNLLCSYVALLTMPLIVFQTDVRC